MSDTVLETEKAAELSAEELREIDARVAVLMGYRWRRQHNNGRVFLARPLCEESVEDVTGREAEFERFADWGCDVPRYSADLGAAAHVLEHVRETFPDSDGFAWTLIDRGDCWKAEIWFNHHDGNVIEHEAAAATLPLAICLAALAKQEAEVTT